jgi:hypothetical protein
MIVKTLPGKLLHFAKIELQSMKEIMIHGMPDALLQFAGGLGDELYLTSVAHELKKRNSALKIWQVSHSSSLLLNNPDYENIFSWDQWYLRYSKLLNSRRMKLTYTTELTTIRAAVPPKEHVTKILCRNAGVTGTIEVRPYYVFGRNEKDSNKIKTGQIAVQCLGKDSYPDVWLNKLWDANKFQAVVDILKNDFKYTVVQLGLPGDPALSGTVDLRGKNSLRDDAMVISQSEFFLGLEGFLMHLARAVNRRSVIIFGGRIHSRQTGYTCNENLDSFVACAPCWQWNHCDYERKCMTMISVEHVIHAVEKLIKRLDIPVEIDTAVI